jgi:hypothetical protein
MMAATPVVVAQKEIAPLFLAEVYDELVFFRQQISTFRL